MTEPLEIRLLGPFEVVSGGRGISIPGSKRQAVLARLALARGQVVTVDDLIDALWGADLPAAPRNAVQHHVARLRAALGHDQIGAAAEGYSLRHAGVDALEFEELLGAALAASREGDPRAAAARAASALDLWRGTALQGLTDPPWFAAESRRLAALRLDALEERFDAALALGEHREVLADLRAALGDDPYRERLWGQLMLALYRNGRQADALDTFHEARRVLDAELGLEPGPELRGLQEAILAHDPAIALTPVTPPRRGNIPASSTSFIGRERELTEVVDLLADHRLVTLIGPPGVGKTRVALETARRLADGVPDGVWFVDLARATAPPDVVRLLARSVDARGDQLDRVVERLVSGEAVIVFDACELLLPEVRRVVESLLQQCPGVRVLATSRQVLHMTGEARITIGPLPVAGGNAAAGDGETPAVRLFLERARTARPGFAPDADTVSQVAEIAARVDGLPLAITITKDSLAGAQQGRTGQRQRLRGNHQNEPPLNPGRFTKPAILAGLKGDVLGGSRSG